MEQRHVAYLIPDNKTSARSQQARIETSGGVIGRHPENALCVDDDNVSRRHCRVFHSGDCWYIEDLGSTNGTYLNGERVHGRHTLADGDRIGVYSYGITFRLSGVEQPEDAAVSADREQAGAAGKRAEAVLAGLVAAAVTLDILLTISPVPAVQSVAPPVPLGVIALIALLGYQVRNHIRYQRTFPPRPVLPVMLVAFLVFSCAGFAGLGQEQLTGGIKEIVQLLIIFVATPYAFCQLREATVDLFLYRVFPAVGGLLLISGTLSAAGLPLVALNNAVYGACVVAATPFLLTFLWRQTNAGMRVPLLLVAGLAAGVTLRNAGLLATWFAVVALTMAWGARQERGRAMDAVLTGAAAFLMTLAPVLFGGRTAWTNFSPKYDDDHFRRRHIERIAAFKAPRYMPLGGGLGYYLESINVLKQYTGMTAHPDNQRIPPNSNNQYLLVLTEAGAPAAIALFGFLLWMTLRPQRVRSDAGRDERRAHKDRLLRLTLGGLLLAGLSCTILGRGIGLWLGVFLGLGFRDLPRSSWRYLWGSAAVFVVAFAAAVFQAINWNTYVDETEPVSTVNRLVRRHLFHDSAGITATGLRIIHLPDKVDGSPNNRTTIQAESGKGIQPPFKIVRQEKDSGNAKTDGYLQIPDNTVAGKGEVNYTVTVPEEGTYRFMARVYWKDGCGNSLGFLVNGRLFELTSGLYKQWHILNTRRTAHLKRGKHTVKIKNLEDGIRVDYWSLKRVSDKSSR